VGWLSFPEVARIYSVSPQWLRKLAAQSQNSKINLKGNELTIRRILGRGGKAGCSYQVDVTSIPADSLPLSVRPLTSVSLPATHPNTYETSYLTSHVAALAAIRSPRERSKAIRQLVENPPIGPDGRPFKKSATTWWRYVKDYSAFGVAALVRQQRNDAGQTKVFVSREFDQAAHLQGIGNERLGRIKAECLAYMRSLIAQGTPRHFVKTLSSRHLTNIANNEGIRGAFKLPSHLIQKERAHRIVAMFRKDRKTYEDQRPRIMRKGNAYMPFEVVYADIHPVDVLLTRTDGSTATARMIAFFCGATKFVFAHFVLCEKGEGVTNRDGISTFVDFVLAHSMPSNLYLDNGSEFNWADHVEAPMRLANQSGALRTSCIVRANPYNGAAKPIERFFGEFERSYLCMMPGYIAGDRMRKKSSSVGKPVAPYPGTFEQFVENVQALLTVYNNTPRRDLGNKSPTEAISAAEQNGWQKTTIDPDALLYAFSDREKRRVRQGKIQLGNDYWTCDALLDVKFMSCDILVGKPTYLDINSWQRLPIFDMNGNPIGFAEREKRYDYLDPEGAKESARRAKVAGQSVYAMEKGLPQLDPLQEALEAHSNIVPLPKPKTDRIRLNPQQQAIVDGIKETPIDKRRREAAEYERQILRAITDNSTGAKPQ
jgi:hypothetical protein